MRKIVKRIVLTTTTLGSFLTSFMASSINIALPQIGKEFSLNALVIGWIPSSYLLASAMVLISLGRIADIYGRKKIFSIGLLLFIISSILSALSPNILFLIVIRVLHGIAGAMIFSTSTAMLISVFPEKERGRAIGINVSSVYIGLTIGPFLGGFITQNFGWRTLFIITGIIGIIDFIILSNIKSDWYDAKGEKFDYAGSFISAISILLLMFGFSNLPKFIGLIFLLISLVGLVTFSLIEKKVNSPLLEISLFSKSKTFVFSNLAALINYSATFGISFLLSLYLQNIKGLSPQMTGLILIVQPAIMAVFSPLAGKSSDIREPQLIASMGMTFTFIGLIMLTFLESSTNLSYIILCLFFIGVGIAFFSSPNINAIMSSVSKKYYGVASGIVSSMRIIGQMLSMAIIMMIISLIMGRSVITIDNKYTYLKFMRFSFIVFAILCFIGIFFSFARGKMRNNND